MQRRMGVLVGAGILLLVLAALLSTRHGWGGRLPAAFLLLAGTAWTLAVLSSWRDVTRTLARRSARYGLNALFLSVLVAVILALVGFLADRHALRLDLTTDREYTLSDKTLNVLQGISKRIHIHVFDEPSRQRLARDLLTEYVRRNRMLRLHLEDINKDPERAERFGVTTLGTIVFDAGEKVERIQAIGEEDVTNALIKVTRPGSKKIYFLTEHGEKDIASKGLYGYSMAADALRRENYQPESLSLAQSKDVPVDSDVLVVAGAKSRLLEHEQLAIQRYLERGGRLFCLFDPKFNCGLEFYLRAWGVFVGDDRIVDTSPTGQLLGRGPSSPLVTTYGVHAITKQFREPTYYEMARSVRPFNLYRGEAESAVLAFTSKLSWADSDVQGSSVQFGDPDDVSGPVSIAMAVRLDVADRVAELESAVSTPKPRAAARDLLALESAGAVSKTEARLVVFGDSDFAGNRNFPDMGNGNMFLNCIAWLTQDEELIAVRSKPRGRRNVSLSKAELGILNLLALAILPAFVAGVGAVVTWRRRARG